jgi:hypothetical protein
MISLLNLSLIFPRPLIHLSAFPPIFPIIIFHVRLVKTKKPKFIILNLGFSLLDRSGSGCPEPWIVLSDSER